MSDEMNVSEEGQVQYQRASSLLSAPDQQIDPGYFLLFQEGTQVGRAFRPAQGGEEHWELFRSYKWPSERNPNVTLRLEYKKQGTSVPVPRDAKEFVAGITSGSTYLHMRAVV
ncbi:hypothetical protein WME99_36565 [Sorangium sp. So ce136]|uniref:hypothetical protein n=1 Tax=Sorangium sp. So ce136 TaxID=3133284 RepID=UPI003EFC8A7A